MNEQLMKLVVNFLDSFSMPFNLNKCKTNLTNISKMFSEENKCFSKIKISFVDKKFAISASMKDNQIFFNKLRIYTLNHLNIDCENKNHMKKLCDFYDNYGCSSYHSRFEDCLYRFIKEYKECGYENELKKIGSYKFVKYEIIETIFHETQHIIQNYYFDHCDITNLKNINDILVIFCVIFEKLYLYLLKHCDNFRYELDNFKFPIEIDARYVAMINMEKIRQKHYKRDVSFAKHIINSNIVPIGVDVKNIAEQIVLDYEEFYNKYVNSNAYNLYSNFNNLIERNRKRIIDEISMRYQNILKIVKCASDLVNNN